ncbi:hypothetical protein [Streptomyces sp. VN1]|nr:hypothetical protein [Streptomyces sp. VN1]QIP71155.1 hypothetical protein EZV63_15800 [Streptomyces sp. VN1]
MRRKPCTRPGAVALLLAPGAALLLAGCGSGGTGEAAADRPTASPTSGSPTAQAQAPAPDATRAGGPSASSPSADADLPVDPGPDPGRGAGSAVDEAFGAALQSGLRYVDPALGTPEGLAGVDAKADAQCADLRRNVADPDRLAAQRFSVGNHKVTEADGKRINTLLRNTYCG